jgi:hypothetical protein
MKTIHLLLLAVLVLRAAACADLAAPAQRTQSSGSSPHGGRKLKQLTVYINTPRLASSTSAAVRGNAQLGPDGTLHGSGGVSATTAAGLSNPLLRGAVCALLCWGGMEGFDTQAM